MSNHGKPPINYDEWNAMLKEFNETKPESTLAKERKAILDEVEIAKKTPATWKKYVETHPITPEDDEDDPEISGTWRTVNKTYPIPIPRKGGRKIRKSRKSRKSRKTRKTRKIKKIKKI